MKRILIFICFTAVLSENSDYVFVTKYIDMPLDHFSFTSNNVTFKLRYLINDSYFEDDHPILFYTGNEGDISMFAQNTGFMFEMGQMLNCLIVFAEHRFYGETLPFGNLSYSSPKYLGYLSSQQALADYVYLIDNLQKTYSKNSRLPKLPVIAFGGSYGGMLAAWLRMKYPYSVAGAIASSAPILQFKGLTPCQNFYKITTDVVRSLGSQKCVDTIKKSWSILRTKTQTDTGKSTISDLFQLCAPLKSEDDINTMLGWLTGIYVNTVMINYPYPANFLVPLPGYPVRELCAKMDSVKYNNDDELLKSIAAGLTVYTNYTGKTKCNNILETASVNLGEKGWNFQCCTDMIMPMCSTDEDMFETVAWDFKMFSDVCYKTFSVRPRNEEIPILEYGGDDLKAASNIVFSNGLLDPWSSGGVLKNVSAQVVSIVIPDGAHHFDLRASNPLDSDSVKMARKFHQRQISKWLEEHYFQNMPEKYLYLLKWRRYL